jgi:hypothetical protein
MSNPATARVWAVCEEGAEAVPGEEAVPEAEEAVPGEEAVPEAEEAVPEAEEAVPGEETPSPPSGDVTVGDVVGIAECRVTVGWVMKKPMNTTTTRMLVITPNVMKAHFHARNRTFRRSLYNEPSKLLLSGCASSTVNFSRTDQLLSIWSLIRSSPSSAARLY